MLHVYCVLLACDVDNSMMLALATWLCVGMQQQESLGDIHGFLLHNTMHLSPEAVEPSRTILLY